MTVSHTEKKAALLLAFQSRHLLLKYSSFDLEGDTILAVSLPSLGQRTEKWAASVAFPGSEEPVLLTPQSPIYIYPIPSWDSTGLFKGPYAQTEVYLAANRIRMHIPVITTLGFSSSTYYRVCLDLGGAGSSSRQDTGPSIARKSFHLKA
jgi:hypothetical protein